MGEYVESDETVAVQSAVVGCCYAQRKRGDKNIWEKRRWMPDYQIFMPI